MSLLDTIRRTFEDASRPSGGTAAPVRELERRVRGEGRVCTREVLLHEIAHPDSCLRTLRRTTGTLAGVADVCPEGERPIGLDETVVAAGRVGVRPTPEDAVRVLARELEERSASARARWSRLVREAGRAVRRPGSDRIATPRRRPAPP